MIYISSYTCIRPWNEYFRIDLWTCGSFSSIDVGAKKRREKEKKKKRNEQRYKMVGRGVSLMGLSSFLIFLGTTVPTSVEKTARYDRYPYPPLNVNESRSFSLLLVFLSINNIIVSISFLPFDLEMDAATARFRWFCERFSFDYPTFSLFIR